MRISYFVTVIALTDLVFFPQCLTPPGAFGASLPVRLLAALLIPVSSRHKPSSPVAMVWLRFLDDTIYASYPERGRISLLRWIRLNREFRAAVHRIELRTRRRVGRIGFVL